MSDSVFIHKHLKNVLLFIYLIIGSTLLAQTPTVAFSADKTSFCEIGTVKFTDETVSASPITSWTWTFGNGNTSAFQNPSVTYDNNGFFTVQLVVCNADGCDSLTKIDYIKNHENPEASFTIDNEEGCVPFDIEFTSTSTSAGGAILSYRWDFADGTIGNGASTTHTYSISGAKSPNLSITDVNGCESTYPSFGTPNVSIEAREPFQPAFTVDNPSSCINYTANFTDTSNYGGNVSFAWDFGDGTKDTTLIGIANHDYTTDGQYDIKLVLISNGVNCTDSITKNNYISLLRDTLEILSSDTICPNELANYSIASNWPVSCTWLMDDVNATSATGNSINFSYTSADAGTNTIQVTAVNDITECVSILTKAVEISNVVANFSIDNPYGCSLPYTFNITNNSSGATDYRWEIGDETFFDENPEYISNTYLSNVDAKLVVSNGICTDSIVKEEQLDIFEPIGNLITTNLNQWTIDDIRGGCLPVTANFTFTSDFGELPYTIDSVHWNFDDGTLDSTNSNSNTHTYTYQNIFYPEATVYNSMGCELIVKDTVGAAERPFFDIVIDNQEKCDMDGLEDIFTNNTAAEKFEWNFESASDPSLSVSFIINTPIEPLDLDTGYFNLTLTSEINGCITDTIMDSVHYVTGAISRASTRDQCGVPADLSFYPYIIDNPSDSSKYNLTYEWTLPDGTKTNDKVATFRADTGGTYTAILFIQDTLNGCTDTDTLESKVKDFEANFTIDTTLGCYNLQAAIEAINLNGDFDSLSFFVNPLNSDESSKTASYPASNLLTKYYHKDSIDSITHIFNGYGYWDVGVKFYNREIGCSLTKSYDSLVYILDQSPRYVVDTVDACAPHTFNFTNSSSADTTIDYYVWSWQDGTTDTTYANSPDTSHTYDEGGNFSPILTVYDVFGCSKSSSDTMVRPTFPSPNFTFYQDTVCFNTPVGVRSTGDVALPYSQPTTLDSALYIWNYGDGTPVDTVKGEILDTHIFAAGGIYNVNLKTIDRNGCEEDTTISILVQQPEADFYTNDPTSRFCPPLSVEFNGDSSSNDIIRYYWDFGDGATAQFDSVVQHEANRTFAKAGPFHIQLVGETAIGCLDTIVKDSMVVIEGPEASIVIDTFEGCEGLQVSFLLTDIQDLNSYSWDFGDGTVDSSDTNPTVYTYTNGGRFIPSVQLWDNQDPVCTYKLPYDEPIFVHEMNANFGIPQFKGCKPIDISFSDSSSLSSDSYNNISAEITDWMWYFFSDTAATTEDTSILQNPTHTFQDTGSYHIKLVIEDPMGCKDSIVYLDTMDIIGIYSNLSMDTMRGCSPLSIDFTELTSTRGTTPVSWNWTFSNGDSSAEQNPTVIFELDSFQFMDSITVTLAVEDDENCLDVITFEDTIAYSKPIPNFFVADSMVCLGDSISFLNLSQGSNLSYEWKFGDGANTSDFNPSHLYTSDGVYDVQILATDTHNCVDSLDSIAYIDIQSPIASFQNDAGYIYCSDTTITFQDSSTRSSIISSWKWYFGDADSLIVNDPDSANVTFTFDSSKMYDVRLEVISTAGCIDDTLRSNFLEIEGPFAVFPKVDTAGCQFTPVSYELSDSNNITRYRWAYGDGDTSEWITGGIETHIYAAMDTFFPTLLIDDGSGCIDTVVTSDNVIIENLEASFTVNESPQCLYDSFTFTNNSFFEDTTLVPTFRWLFGDGDSLIEREASHLFNYSDTFLTTLYIRSGSSLGCLDTFTKQIIVDSIPVINTIPDDTICIGDSIELTSFSQGSIIWTPNYALSSDSILSPIASPDTFTIYTLTITDSNGCIKDTSIRITTTGITNYEWNYLNDNLSKDTSHCVPMIFSFDDTATVNITNYNWDFGDGTGSTARNVVKDYNVANDYIKQLRITSGFDDQCLDTFSRNVSIDTIPIIREITLDTLVCVDSLIPLIGIGQGDFIWKTSSSLANTFVDSLGDTASILATTSGTYYAYLYSVENCYSIDSLDVTVYTPPPGDVFITPGDTEVVDGSLIPLMANITYPGEIFYEWYPKQRLSCANCDSAYHIPNPDYSAVYGSHIYTVVVRDRYNCLLDDDEVLIDVRYDFSSDIPDAFSPNGDGNNDILYVRGWGIEELLEFRIYNRWGEVVFETTDLNEGWDGNYQGEPVQAGTYVYTLRARSSIGQETQLLKGDILLIR